jgi:hypothetical protein
MLGLLTAAQQSKLIALSYDEIRYPTNLVFVPSRETLKEVKCVSRFGNKMGIFGMIKYSYVANFIMATANTSLSLLVAYPNAD